MHLIAGLGNPGREYKETRHNLGFLVLDNLLEMLNKSVSPESKNHFNHEEKYNSLVAKISQNNKKIILAKPQTFMNSSGEAIAKITRFFDIHPKNLLIIHDDLDLPLGKMRFSFGSSPAGHNGVRSIIEKIGTADFTRLRIGIHADSSPLLQSSGLRSNFVLQKFPPDELEIIQKLFPVIEESILCFINFGYQKTAERYN